MLCFDNSPLCFVLHRFDPSGISVNFVDHHLVIIASAGGMRELSGLIRVDGFPWFVDHNKKIFSLFMGALIGLGWETPPDFICFVDCCVAIAS